MISLAVLQDFTGSSDTATLASFEASAVSWLEKWVPRYLGVPKTLTELQDGPRRQHGRLSGGRDDGERLRTLWLSEEIELSALISIEERSSSTSPWKLLDLADYEIRGASPSSDAGRKLVKLSGPWPAGRANIRIKFTHGYVEDDGPDDVTMAILQTVNANVTARNSGGKSNMKEEGSSVGYFNPSLKVGVDQTLLMSLKRPSY